MPNPSEDMRRSLRGVSATVALALGVAACGGGATDVPDIPLTQVVRLDVLVDGDSIVLGDTLRASVRGVNRVGDVLPLTGTQWASADSGVLSVSDGGVIRARNLGSVRLDVTAAGVVGTRTVRVVPRPYQLTLVAPDSVDLVDQIQMTSRVTTSSGALLPEVAPRFASTDTSVAQVQPSGVGRAAVQALRIGTTDLLAIVGRDTTRRRMVVRVTPLRALSVRVEPRVVAVGDSVPFGIAASDTLGRNAPSGAVITEVEPAGMLALRKGYLVGLTAGRAVISATNGTVTARDTIIVQGPSEFMLDIVDGNPQFPLPAKVRASMERVTQKWRTVIRTSPPGEFVRLAVGDCRNAIPIAQFITGLRVLIKLDTLPARIAGQGGPCVLRPNGLPLLGTISLNILNYNNLSDRKLDDLILHEVGHVLGLGTIWGRGALAPLVDGDSSSVDPIFVGNAALAAFSRIGQSGRFTGRTVPLQLNLRGHWRANAFLGEVMAPSLVSADQPMSAVTVAALRDLGWTVELDAYEDFTLPEAVLSPPPVTARVLGARPAIPTLTLDGDVLLPEIMVISGQNRRLDPATGRLRFR